ncbi:MAG: DUF4232 domain-containing protein [Corynebacterium variabile]|uniref:DUF4232 domain-containing protein n=1 Tax=Corynebacterium variabile TaxID=1727 RepID=UPI0026476AA5|nr:DUF4232 domain-containing protein [Corynebacterium variabile]MDN6536499.1 DUF4232 domain-containing protein [Corynebacterium variabile]
MSIRTPLSSHRTGAVTAVALAAVVVLGACSNDSSDSDNAADGATTTPTEAALTGDAPDGSSSGSSGSDGDRCHTSDLDVSVGDPDGAAGSVYRQLIFTNSSASDCTISGYPGVSLVAGGDTQVGAAADREDTPGEAPVITLSPGDAASADLKISNPGVYGDQCTATPADALKIYPPDEKDSTTVTVDGLTGCTGDDAPVTLRISRLQG